MNLGEQQSLGFAFGLTPAYEMRHHPVFKTRCIRVGWGERAAEPQRFPGEPERSKT